MSKNPNLGVKLERCKHGMIGRMCARCKDDPAFATAPLPPSAPSWPAPTPQSRVTPAAPTSREGIVREGVEKLIHFKESNASAGGAPDPTLSNEEGTVMGEPYRIADSPEGLVVIEEGPAPTSLDEEESAERPLSGGEAVAIVKGAIQGSLDVSIDLGILGGMSREEINLFFNGLAELILAHRRVVQMARTARAVEEARADARAKQKD